MVIYKKPAATREKKPNKDKQQMIKTPAESPVIPTYQICPSSPTPHQKPFEIFKESTQETAGLQILWPQVSKGFKIQNLHLEFSSETNQVNLAARARVQDSWITNQPWPHKLLQSVADCMYRDMQNYALEG